MVKKLDYAYQVFAALNYFFLLSKAKNEYCFGEKMKRKYAFGSFFFFVSAKSFPDFNFNSFLPCAIYTTQHTKFHTLKIVTVTLLFAFLETLQFFYFNRLLITV